MINLLSDFAFWSYGISFLLALIGFIMFAGWWWHIGRTTEIYVYILLLFLADTILFGGNVHIRIIRIEDPMTAIRFSDTFIWHARSILHIAIMALILCRMIRRIRRTLRYEKKLGEKKTLEHRRRECPECDSPNHMGSGLDDNE